MVGVKSSSKKGMAMAEEEVEVIKGTARDPEEVIKGTAKELEEVIKGADRDPEELLRTPLTQLEEGATAILCCGCFLTLPK